MCKKLSWRRSWDKVRKNIANPLVAIVGRPNVGKSTLFNRLMGERRAIVSNVPGTTRDRLSATITWRNRSFVLVDTGGLEVVPTSNLWEKVKAQVEMAIEEADAIIFLTNVGEGVTSEDRDIAQLLRQLGKPVLVAVNKVDNHRRELEAVEFHEMGLGEPMYISAYHNLGIDDLMEEANRLLPIPAEHSKESEMLRMAIVGRTNVGKSHLLNSILGQYRSIVSDVPGTTRDAIDIQMSFAGRPVTLIDTAGVRRRGRIEGGIEKYSVLRTLRAIERSNVCMLVVDASEAITAQDTHIAGEILESYKGVVIVVNKWDLVEKRMTRKEMLQEISHRLKFIPYAPVCFASALLGTGVQTVVEKAIAVYQEGSKMVSHQTLNRTLMSALSSHPPTGRKGRPLKIYGISQKSNRPPTFVLPVNDTQLIHFSYKRYLENRLRSAFGFAGNPLHLVFSNRDKGRNR